MIQPKKYLKKRLVDIFRIFNQPKASFTNETFHELRLVIKKFKSFLEFLEFTNSISLEVCELLKKVFRISGEIRNHQITITKLSFIYPEMLDNYRFCIDKKIKKLKLQFFKMINHISLKKIYAFYKKNLNHCEPINYKSVNHYINKLKSDIVYKFYKNLGENETLHAERILLKKYIYMQKFIKSPQFNQPKLIGLTEILGNWHDNLIIKTELIKSIQYGEIIFNELNDINICLKKINKVKNYLYEQSLKKISTLVIDNPTFLTFHVYI